MYDMFYYESVGYDCRIFKNLIVKYCQKNIFDLLGYKASVP